MRRRIRLTGRKQLPQSSINIKVAEIHAKKVIALTIANPTDFKGFPNDAKVKLRLSENKVSETLDFGTVGTLKPAAELRNDGFVAPSCMLRVVATEIEKIGLLLASTDSFTLKTKEPAGQGGRPDGILMFQPKDIAPRTWSLDIRDFEHPVVYVDNRIPNARLWVQTDPVFISCVLPAILGSVFLEILNTGSPDDIKWMADWLKWSDGLMPGEKRPPQSSEQKEKAEWIDKLIVSFSHQHKILDSLCVHVKAGEEKAA
jgi:hypothetical protein